MRSSNGSKFNVLKDCQETSGQSKSTTAVIGMGSFASGVFLALVDLGTVVVVIKCTR